MNGRIKTAIFILSALIAISGVLWIVFRSHEPVYQGKLLSYWLEEVNRASNLSETRQASAAIRAMGTNSLPFLLRHIEHRPSTASPVKQSHAKFARKLSLVKNPLLEPEPLVYPSLWAVRQLGADAKPLIPVLIKLLDDPDRSRRGEMGLCAIGRETIPALVTACHSADERSRATAALLIARVSVKNDGWGWGWRTSPDGGRIRFHLVSFVTDAVVDALRRNLRHSDASVRRATGEALKKLDDRAIRAVPDLMVALKDEVPAIREAALDALKQIAPEAIPKAEAR